MMTPVGESIQVMGYHRGPFARIGNARFPECPQQAGWRRPWETGPDANGVTT